MKICKLYSNFPNIFEDIHFNENGLNIILASIKEKKDIYKNAHNVGKTTLISLLDFMLLRHVNKQNKDELFLFKHLNKFSEFIFFLEIKLKDKEYLTIKRSIGESNKISFKKATEGNKNFTDIGTQCWDHANIALESAAAILDSLLAFSSISPWGYRKIIPYIFRTQNDWGDTFHRKKFAGSHKDWKPYLFHLLGFDGETARKKYELEEDIKKHRDKLKTVKDIYANEISKYDDIKGELRIVEKKIIENEKNLESGDFSYKENITQEELSYEIEDEISYYNEQKYALNYEIEECKKNLKDKIKFDLNEIQSIFEDASIYFGDQIKKDYQDLVAFNESISEDRNEIFKEQLQINTEKLFFVEKKLRELNKKRQKHISFLKEKNILAKYGLIQEGIGDLRVAKEQLETQLIDAEKMLAINKDITTTTSKKELLGIQLDEAINSGNEKYEKIRDNLSLITRNTTSEDSKISICTNKSKNLEFDAQFIDDSGYNTSISKGHTYKKILCAAFDLAVLITYSQEKFFHFVCHDGILDGVDNKIKINFIEFIRGCCEKNNLQYIVTVLCSDSPELTDDYVSKLKSSEIIKTLHDKDEQGRLFKMEVF